MKGVPSTRFVVAFSFAAFLSVCLMNSAHSVGSVARVASEPSIGGLTPEEYWDDQQQLHEWLMSDQDECFSTDNTNIGKGKISCDAAGCSVDAVDVTEQYKSVSADGRDTDRMILLPQ